MEMSSEVVSSTLKDYFTLKDNEIICDFCLNSYDITINKEDVREHLMKHEMYKNVSSKDIQKHLKEFYTVHNNTIKCKHFDKLYISSNAHSIIKYHLGIGHKTDENKVKKIYNWIREKYKGNESDAKLFCNDCKENIRNRPIFLITHLALEHKDESHLAHRPSYDRHPNQLDSIFDEWMWDFFRRNGENAQCSVCIVTSFKYLTKNRTEIIQPHMKNIHPDETYVSSRGSSPSKKCHYSEIQDDQIKCNLCKTEMETKFHINSNLKEHLLDEHQIDCAKSKILREWLFQYIDKLEGFQKSQCKIDNCNMIFRQMCFYDIKDHFIFFHKYNIPPAISSMGQSSSPGSLLSSDENVEHIPTLSGDPQADCKSSDIEVCDVVYDSGIKSVKRKSSSLLCSDKNVEDIPITSRGPQPGNSQSLDISADSDRDSGKKKVKYDDDKRPPDGSSSRSSSSLKPVEDAGNTTIATSSADIEDINVSTMVGSIETMQPDQDTGNTTIATSSADIEDINVSTMVGSIETMQPDQDTGNTTIATSSADIEDINVSTMVGSIETMQPDQDTGNTTIATSSADINVSTMVGSIETMQLILTEDSPIGGVEIDSVSDLDLGSTVVDNVIDVNRETDQPPPPPNA